MFFQKYLRGEYYVKALLCVTGVFIIGIGVSFMRYADFGIDPYMCFMNGLHLAVFQKMGLSFGTTFAISSFLMVSAVLIFDRSKLGLGTVATIALTGYISDLGVFLCSFIAIEGAALFILRAGMVPLGIVLIAIGSGIYFNTNVGVSPYDGIGLIITEKTGKPNWYRWIRIGTDLICVSLGFSMGNMPGVGTLIMALFTGPLFAFFRRRMSVWGKELGIITW